MQIPHLLTQASFDVPMPSMVFASPDLEVLLAKNRLNTGTIQPIVNSHISQLVAARIRYDNGMPSYKVDYSISQLCAELIAGEKMNLNRPLGNGYDDNSNGIIDEPGEAEAGPPPLNVTNVTTPPAATGWSIPGGSPGVANNPQTGFSFDMNNDGNADGRTRRQRRWKDTNQDGFIDAFAVKPPRPTNGGDGATGNVSSTNARSAPLRADDAAQ